MSKKEFDDLWKETTPKKLKSKYKIPFCSKCGYLSFKEGGDHKDCDDIDEFSEPSEKDVKLVARSLNWMHGIFGRKLGRVLKECITDAAIFKHEFPEIWDRHVNPYGECKVCGFRASLKNERCYMCQKK